jgi:hypothetical protein
VGRGDEQDAPATALPVVRAVGHLGTEDTAADGHAVSYYPALLIDGVGGRMSVWLPDPFEVVRWPIVAPVSCVPVSDTALPRIRLPLA